MGRSGERWLLFPKTSMSKTNPKPISYAGTFERVLDVKNRVTIPAGWLNGGPDEFHAVPSHTGDYLIVMPAEEFNSIETQFRESGLPRDQQRKAIRQFYGQARAVSADAQGRILLPEEQWADGAVLKFGMRNAGLLSAPRKPVPTMRRPN